jgi:hypothetical protein
MTRILHFIVGAVIIATAPVWLFAVLIAGLCARIANTGAAALKHMKG